MNQEFSLFEIRILEKIFKFSYGICGDIWQIKISLNVQIYVITVSIIIVKFFFVTLFFSMKSYLNKTDKSIDLILNQVRISLDFAPTKNSTSV